MDEKLIGIGGFEREVLDGNSINNLVRGGLVNDGNNISVTVRIFGGFLALIHLLFYLFSNFDMYVYINDPFVPNHHYYYGFLKVRLFAVIEIMLAMCCTRRIIWPIVLYGLLFLWVALDVLITEAWPDPGFVMVSLTLLWYSGCHFLYAYALKQAPASAQVE
jgi:hypothetical protein